MLFHIQYDRSIAGWRDSILFIDYLMGAYFLGYPVILVVFHFVNVRFLQRIISLPPKNLLILIL